MARTTLRNVKQGVYGVGLSTMLVLHHDSAGAGNLYASRYSLAGAFLESLGTLTDDDPLSAGDWFPAAAQLISAAEPRVFFMTSINDPLGTLIVWNLATASTVKLTPLETTWSSVSDGDFVAFKPPIYDRAGGLLWWVQFRNVTGDTYEWQLRSASPSNLTPTVVSSIVAANPVHDITFVPWNFGHPGYLFETAFDCWLTDEAYRLITYQRFIDAYPGISSFVDAPRFMTLLRDGNDGTNEAVPAYWGGEDYGVGTGNLTYPFGIPDPLNAGRSLAISPEDNPQYLAGIDDVPEVTPLSSDLGAGNVVSLVERGGVVSMGVDVAGAHRLDRADTDGSNLVSVTLQDLPLHPSARLVGAFAL